MVPVALLAGARGLEGSREANKSKARVNVSCDATNAVTPVKPNVPVVPENPPIKCAKRCGVVLSYHNKCLSKLLQ